MGLPSRRARADRRAAEEFARRVDAPADPAGALNELDELAELTSSLRRAGRDVHAPDIYRAALRDRLLAASPDVASEPAAVRPAAVPRRWALRVPTRWALGATVGALLLGGAGAAGASERALPGDALYPVKRSIEDTRLALAFDEVSEGRLYLRQAERRLAEVEELIRNGGAAGREQDIDAALHDMEEDLRLGSARVIAASATESADALRLLDEFVTASAVRVETMRLTLPAGPTGRRAASTLQVLGDLRDQARCLPGCPLPEVADGRPAATPTPQADTPVVRPSEPYTAPSLPVPDPVTPPSTTSPAPSVESSPPSSPPAEPETPASSPPAETTPPAPPATEPGSQPT